MSAVVSDSAMEKAPIPEGHVSIEIDGVALTAPKGSMIIHAADRMGVAIPRFCYHDKLPIAANCRMCLVDVEKSPKPLPACATPVMEGMKIQTQSVRALDAQRNVMEFLLINHPLDCPICDQGGECELQDVAMGYGRSVSRFSERKRVVPDENMGPLVATDMTRCIHCTRCVRFVSEISGTYELGGMGRGENLSIGTYIGKAVDSELSGNVIDVCPVGALTNKVFRFRARPWELIARASIGYHDALGSNLWLHVRRGEVMRCVPRENEAINECWLSDRDRYSHQGLNAPDRLVAPMVRNRDGALVEASWDQALAALVPALTAHRGDDLGMLLSPATSCEEGFLLARLMQALGQGSIDHRLRVSDPADRAAAQTFAVPLAEIEKADAILLIGSDPRREAPLLSHRIRKAAVGAGNAPVFVLNAVDFAFNFDLAGRLLSPPHRWVEVIDALAAGRAVADCEAETVTKLRKAFENAKRPLVILGDQAVQHAQSQRVRASAHALAAALGARLNEVPQGANAVGLARMGALPATSARPAASVVAEGAKAMVLYGCEPEDFAQPAQLERALGTAELSVVFASFAHPLWMQHADVLLPIGLTPEIEATLVNADGFVQSTAAGGALPGQTRPGWKVLRALGAALQIEGFEFTDLAGLRASMPDAAVPLEFAPPHGSALPRTESAALAGGAFSRLANVPIYRTDAVVRRASALQASSLAADLVAALHPDDAEALGLSNGEWIDVGTNGVPCALTLVTDERVARGCVWIPAGFPVTAALGATGAPVTIGASPGKKS